MPQTTRKFLKPKMIRIPGREEPVLARLTPKRTIPELPSEGDWRPWNSYWRRRVDEGSAEEATPPAAGGTKSPPKKKKKED